MKSVCVLLMSCRSNDKNCENFYLFDVWNVLCLLIENTAATWPLGQLLHSCHTASSTAATQLLAAPWWLCRAG